MDLERELKVVTEAAPPGEELRAGDKHGCWLQMNFGRGTESPEYTSSEQRVLVPVQCVTVIPCASCLVLFHVVNDKVGLAEQNFSYHF